jgi:flagellar biosynthetic protein FlhB
MSDRSGQPTEQPTQRRQEQAAKDGQIAFSSELIGGMIVLSAMIFFMQAGDWFFQVTLDSLREGLTYFDPMIEAPDSILIIFRHHITNVGLACLGLMLPLAAVVLVVGAMQTRFNITTKPLAAKWSNMSPMAGLKRIFSTRALNRGGLSIVKTIAIIVSAYWITMSHLDAIFATGFGTFESLLSLGASVILQIGMVTGLLMVAVGGVDLAFQIWKQHQDLMMTKQEVRDEQKDTEGDPQIRARLRRIRNEMNQKRIVQEVPKATVVITNPTHFAVALKYDLSVSKAPIVVAKGADHLAKKIIRIAKENGVAVVERKPVARFLYANVKVGKEIPLQLYQAVAEILNYVRRFGASP